MPAVIAFQRQPNGNVDIKFGEVADALRDVRDKVLVVRNIKRYALLSDNYVREQLEWHHEQQKKEEWPPAWFDLDTSSIRPWNGTESMPVEEAIRQILKEAISRSGLAGTVAEWRAGCPVSSGLAYRKALVSALDDLGCTGRIEWITEEPLLLTALGRAIRSLKDGHYLIYDLGGGSFDCAIVEVVDNQLIVLADEGLPTLGGMDIDEKLIEKLDYRGSPQILRIAKEQLSSENMESLLDSGQTLTVKHVEDVLEEGEFINKTLITMVNAYKKAQLIMGNSHIGGWQSVIEDMRKNIDRVLVVGGPTQMPYFTKELGEIFGDDKVVTADDLTRAADRTDILDPALTALSHGACYMYGHRYTPLTVDRIPAKITLKVTGGHSTEEDSYEPFRILHARKLFAPDEGRLLIRRPLYPHESTTLDSDRDSTYSVLITSPDGNVLYESEPHDMRMPREGYLGPRADRIGLIVDRLGGVKVRLQAGFTHIPKPLEDIADIPLDPPWQPALQKEGPIQQRYRRGRQRLEAEPSAQSGRLDSYDTSIRAAYDESQRRA